MREPLNIVFLMTQFGVTRHYLSVIEELASRGHRVSLFFNRVKKNRLGEGQIEGEEILNDLSRRYPQVEIHRQPLPARDGILRTVRVHRNYLRYFHPDYAGADKLRGRLEGMVSGPWRGIYRLVGLKADPLLKKIENMVPPDKETLKFLGEQKPDLLLISRLIDPDCPQADYVKAAHALKIPVAACIASWDNLTNKGILQIAPDRVFVWNEFQRKEAERYHGIPKKNVVVTGAQTFDSWFEKKPEFTLDEICRRVGLAREGAYLLYTCSSRFICDEEVGFVRRWLSAVRASSLRDINIVIRPHPQNAKQWESVLPDDERTVVYPRGGQYVNDPETKSFYFALMYHCRAVVGVNTSAMVEAGIFDKPVFTVLDPQFALTQGGTLHFSYLVDEGLARKASSLSEHVMQLETETEGDRERRRAFVKKFLRPKGMGVSATKVFVEEVEKAAKELRPC